MVATTDTTTETKPKDTQFKHFKNILREVVKNENGKFTVKLSVSICENFRTFLA